MRTRPPSLTVLALLTVLVAVPAVSADVGPETRTEAATLADDAGCGIQPRRGDSTDADVDEGRLAVWFTVYLESRTSSEGAISTGAEVAPFCTVVGGPLAVPA